MLVTVLMVPPLRLRSLDLAALTMGMEARDGRFNFLADRRRPHELRYFAHPLTALTDRW